MISPLLSAEQQRRPSWISWTAHVRLLTFVLRHSFTPADLDTLDVLINDYDAKFHLAYKGAYRRPKHHMLRHLRKYIELYGPPRAFWCMSGEAFLQRLKKLFKVCNYKSAPNTVLTMWNQRRALRFRKQGSMFDDEALEWDSPAYAGIDVALQAASSQVRAVFTYISCYTCAMHDTHMQHACYMHTHQLTARSFAVSHGSFSGLS